MDETDKPKDSVDIPRLDKTLHEELTKIIERSNQPPDPMDWTPEEQTALGTEVSAVDFNPAHANPHFPDRQIIVDGREVHVHGYNNFPLILKVLDTVRHSSEPASAQSFEAHYAAVAGERRYHEIFGALEQNFPALYRRSRQIFESRGNPAVLRGKELTQDEMIYIQSQAYSAAAEIARQLDPVYELAYLYN